MSVSRSISSNNPTPSCETCETDPTRSITRSRTIPSLLSNLQRNQLQNPCHHRRSASRRKCCACSLPKRRRPCWLAEKRQASRNGFDWYWRIRMVSVLRSVVTSNFRLTHSRRKPDFVHVLSLKGQFQYVSPSVRRVLEYEPEDLLNKHISDICHPSDIVPVMRELKDATHTPSDGRQPQAINMLFRVRRKMSGYIWLESSGRLQVESGKGRKAMVLTGRDRTLPAFCWKALDDHGGLTDTEVWAKVSLDGLVLWVTGCVGDIFGGRTNDLVGKSIYSFMAGAEDGPPGPDGHSSSLAVEKAISTSAEGLPKRGATSVRHQLIGLDGRTREVTSNFFAAGSSSAGPITPSRESPTALDDDTGSNVSSFMEDLPFQILVQIKSTPTGIQKPKSAIVHPLTENVFEEMDTTRGTSWQYELHQLKIANRKLKDDIQALRTGQKSNKSSDVEDDGKRAKAKKRKANETGPQPTTDHPTPLHQQTPGFGLAPGRVFKTWS